MWGRASVLRGQLGPVYVIEDALTPAQVSMERYLVSWIVVNVKPPSPSPPSPKRALSPTETINHIGDRSRRSQHREPNEPRIDLRVMLFETFKCLNQGLL